MGRQNKSDPNWMTRVQDRAVGYAARVGEEFDRSVRAAEQIVPDLGNDMKLFIFNTTMDALIGGVVNVAMRYSGINSAVESALVEGIHQKYKQAREASLGGEREMRMVEKEEP